MRTFRGIRALVAALAVTGLTIPTHAATPCWPDRAASAAGVRELQTVLMVAALRCRAAGIDIVADYDGFVATHQGALTAANLLIKAHFAASGAGQADYDRFATMLANGHGDDATNAATCGAAAALARDGTVAEGAALDPIVARVAPVDLPGGRCAARTMAGSPISRDQPPIVMAAAPPPLTPPVTLPADVVAALTVLARYAPSPAVAAPTLQVAAIAP